jgi:small subunit ribosomal protein S2
MAKYKLPKIEDLFEDGVHFGHQVRRWNPNMEPYIFIQRSGIHIIDLDDTHKGLKEAADFLHEVASGGGQIIFIGTKRQASEIIELEAERAGALFVNERWLGGTITNYRIIRKNMDKLVDFMKKKESGEFDKYTKKERLLIDREIEKLQKSVGGIVNLQGKPAAIFVVDSRREKTAVKEANIAGIPVAAIVDTNSDPTVVDYPIPGNDDAIRSIASIVKVVADAVESGYAEYARKAEKEAEEKAKEAESVAKEVEEAKEKPVVVVSGTEATHVSEDVGKEHVEKVESGEEEGEAAGMEKVSEPKEEEKPKKKRGRPKKTEKEAEEKPKKRGRPKKIEK